MTAIASSLIRNIVAIAKKLLPANTTPEYITRLEFHNGLDTVRDRIAAGYLALSEKLDANHTEIERRLDRLDTAVARLDERTKSRQHTS